MTGINKIIFSAKEGYETIFVDCEEGRLDNYGADYAEHCLMEDVATELIENGYKESWTALVMRQAEKMALGW